MSVVVALSPHEIRLAAFTGCERHLASREQDLYDKAVIIDKWDADIESAAAEMAVHKALDSFWNGRLNSFKGPDLGKNIQIRSTKYSNGHLILRPMDNPDHLYILVTGQIPVFTVVGRIQGREAMVDTYAMQWGNGDRAWKIPQDALKPITEESKCQLPR